MSNVNILDTRVMSDRVLTKADRCERCGAQAFIETNKNDFTLLFCKHHGREYSKKLRADGWKILDHSEGADFL